MVNYENIRKLIQAELAEQASELCKSIVAEHSGKPVDWVSAESESLKQAKQNIDAYDEVQWEKQNTERELGQVNHSIDYETGCAVGQYDVLTRMLSSYDEWLEEFDHIHSKEFDHMVERLTEAMYPEEG